MAEHGGLRLALGLITNKCSKASNEYMMHYVLNASQQRSQAACVGRHTKSGYENQH